MEASWPSGKVPMPPHLSHGNGHQIDLALYYENRNAQPLAGPPIQAPPEQPGYGAYEPPRREAERVCVGNRGPDNAFSRPDPPNSRSWRLDEGRTANLVTHLVQYKRVRRIFIEPHLKKRLGLSQKTKVRFAGCWVARHDDHIHVDFY
jgi:hypothetical protein